jgi:hypothetical protein
MPLAFHFSQKVATRLQSIIAVLRNKQNKNGFALIRQTRFYHLNARTLFLRLRCKIQFADFLSDIYDLRQENIFFG